jgi:hypothetical protein
METPGVGDPAVAWVQRFLCAFAWFNNKANHCYTFAEAVPKPGSVREAVEGRFPVEVDGPTLTPVADWPARVRGLLGRWPFQVAEPTREHLADPRRSFSVFGDHFRGMLLDEAVDQSTSPAPTHTTNSATQTRDFDLAVATGAAVDASSRTDVSGRG